MRRNVTDFDRQDVDALNDVGSGRGPRYTHDSLLKGPAEISDQLDKIAVPQRLAWSF
jgi:hypothetical protein